MTKRTELIAEQCEQEFLSYGLVHEGFACFFTES